MANSTTAAINENGQITTIADSTFQFVGSAALSGSKLILTCSATNIAAPADVKYIYFSGSK